MAEYKEFDSRGYYRLCWWQGATKKTFCFPTLHTALLKLSELTDRPLDDIPWREAFVLPTQPVADEYTVGSDKGRGQIWAISWGSFTVRVEQPPTTPPTVIEEGPPVFCPAHGRLSRSEQKHGRRVRE